MSRPAPSPRRWPDLLIGLLVALLLVGFALLLFRPEGRPAAPTSAAPATDTNSPAATIPAAPGTDSSAAAPETAPSAGVPDATATATPPTADPATAPTDAEPPTIAAAPEITPAPQSSTPEAIPESGGEAAAPDTATNGATPEDTAAETPSAEPATPDAAPEDNAAPSAAPRSGGAVATSEQRTPLRSDYRISLGTFGSEQAARVGTAGVSTLGYTVYPIDLGSTVVAQIGPFADESSARQALADIQRAYPRALLYPPRDRSLSSGTSSGGAASTGISTPSSTPAASPAAAPAREEAAASAPAPSGPTYLQVGAFDRVESAQRLVSQLRDLGYAPTVNAPEGRKVSVLVGPFTGDALTRTEQRLSGNGLDHFRVR